MPKFRVPAQVEAAVAQEVVQAVEDPEAAFQMFLDQTRTGRIQDLVAIDGDQDWTWGTQAAGGQGAVVMVNNDDDDGSHFPDNTDARVNGADDRAELAPLHLKFTGVPAIPADWRAWLKIEPADRLRVFASDAADAAELLGPTTEEEVELTAHQLTACQGGGELRLRMEGVTYAGNGFADGLVKITFKVRGTAGEEKSDSAKVRVAPWMIPHHGVQALEVFVGQTDDNEAFRTALDGMVFMAGGCVLRPLPPATEVSSNQPAQVLDAADYHGMRALLLKRNNYQRILRPAIIRTPDEFYWNRADLSLAQVAAACRSAIDDDTPLSEDDLLDIADQHGETNRDFLARKGNPDQAWLKVSRFWKVTDTSPDALERVARRFLDPPATLQEMFDASYQGQTNAQRLLRPGQRVYLPDDEDRWMQDCMEIGYTSVPGRKLNAVMRAPRNRPLRSAPAGMLARDFGYHAPGSTRSQNTFDSNGNLEVTPPCTAANGKVYPWGRIYFGNGRPNQRFDAEVAAFLDAQEVQAPIRLDTDWLQVGHVDEMMSWVPVPTAGARRRAGFPYRLLVAAPQLALDLLTRYRHRADPQRGIMWRYTDLADRRDRGEALYLGNRQAGAASIDAFFTAGMGSHREFRDWQAAVQGRINGVIAQLKTDTGVQDDEIIHVPILYEKNAKGNYEALTAAMVNMLVINAHCVIPKPFGPIVNGVDIFQDEVNTKLTALGLTPHWIDDWYEYHDQKGEVHCGTNTLRNPPVTAWWEFTP